MTGLAILVELRRLGVENIRVESGQIIVRPLSVIPAELREAAAENKAELLRLLADPDTARIAQLDAERHSRDRLACRGYDYDRTAPRYTDFSVSVHNLRIERLEQAPALDPGRIDPLGAAKCLIRTCREYGVGLCLASNGTLVVASNDRAWRSLVRAIETHVEGIAELIEAGRDSNDA
jgi:hypothetical protein